MTLRITIVDVSNLSKPWKSIHSDLPTNEEKQGNINIDVYGILVPQSSLMLSVLQVILS